MPLECFEIRNLGPIGYAKCDQVPDIMIIAGPNGVGKSTLLEAIRTGLRGTGSMPGISPWNPPRVVKTGNPKPILIPPYRAPLAFPIHKFLIMAGPQRKLRDTLSLDSYSPPSAPGVNISVPTSQRTRITVDVSPYLELKYRIARLKEEHKELVYEVFMEHEGKLTEDILNKFPIDVFKPLRVFVERFLPGISFEDVIIEGNHVKIYFRTRAGARVEFDQLSSGERDILALFSPFIEKQIENELARAKDESIPNEDLVILIDSPEAYLHPSLQRAFLD